MWELRFHVTPLPCRSSIFSLSCGFRGGKMYARTCTWGGWLARDAMNIENKQRFILSFNKHFGFSIFSWPMKFLLVLLNICNVLILRYLSSFMVFSVMVAINHGHDYDLYRQFFVFRTLYRYAMLKKLPGIMRWVAVLNELNDTKHKSSSAAAAIESIRRHSNDNF